MLTSLAEPSEAKVYSTFTQKVSSSPPAIPNSPYSFLVTSANTDKTKTASDY